MRSPPRPELLAGVAVALAAAAAVLALERGGGAPARQAAGAAVTWQGLVGGAHPLVSLGDRQIVLLRAPSVAQRLARVGYATEDDERRWTAQAYASQEEVLTQLAAHGVGVRPDYSFARVVNGFSASLDPRAVALLEESPAVAGVYPVRAAFPAALSAAAGTEAAAPASGVELPGYDGRGITIALLDTGVDRAQPYLHGRVEPGIDLIGAGEGAEAQTSPDDPRERERHGTELAGLLVGAGGPGGARGAAPGATVLPIRVAGWQPDAEGRSVVYARTDQLIAGLDRAADPDGDGDAHDAARVALLGVAVPFAGFADSPLARAVDGAFALDVLVVAPAGNDGAAGPLFGAVGGPAGARGALAVGATDERPAIRSAHTVLRRGLEVVLDERLPLLGAVAPARGELGIGVPRAPRPEAASFFDEHGFSLVAGRAALVPAGRDPGAAAVAASRAGAAAVLLYGKGLPPGALGLSSDLGVPVVAVPEAAARSLLAARRAGEAVGVAFGEVRDEPNPRQGSVAPFSSRGLSFGGLVRPELVAPGVALATSDPGAAADGEPAFATLNGTSVAAAGVAGAAALLAQARPGLGARDLASLLVGYARRLPGAGETAAGAGAVDPGAGAAAELVASKTSLSFGAWQGPRWRSARTFTLRNVSSRRLAVSLDVPSGTGLVRVTVRPRRLVVRPGEEATVTVTASAEAPVSEGVASGIVALEPAGSQTLRLPWAVAFPPRGASLLPRAALDRERFAPSDDDPAVLQVQAGRVETGDGGIRILPVARLDVLLYTAGGAFVGRLARLRDVLPGSYSFGITGRGPEGLRLLPGRYELRLVAVPTLPGRPTRVRVPFEIQ